MLNNLIIENSIKSKLNVLEKLGCASSIVLKGSMSRSLWRCFHNYGPKVHEILNFGYSLSLKIQYKFNKINFFSILHVTLMYYEMYMWLLHSLKPFGFYMIFFLFGHLKSYKYCIKIYFKFESLSPCLLV